MKRTFCLILATALLLTAGCAEIKGQGAQAQAISTSELERVAQQGDSEAQYSLADRYLSGMGVLSDCRKALFWLEKAALQGNVDAEMRLGTFYLSPVSGTPLSRCISVEDKIQARKWYGLAAQNGGIGQNGARFGELGYAFSILEEPEKARHWYNKGAENGDSFAQAQLGEMYFYGRGVRQDLPTAYMWFNIASAAGAKDPIDASDARRIAAEQMTKEQIVEAQRLTREWLNKHPQGSSQYLPNLGLVEEE